MAQETLDGKELGSVSIDGSEIQAVPDELDEQDVLGWIGIYTIGPAFAVDRTWLEENAAELGLPMDTLPSETSDRRAFTRAFNRASSEVIVRLDLEAESRLVEFDAYRDSENKKMFNLEVTDRRDGKSHSEVIGSVEFDDGSLISKPQTEDDEYLGLYAAYDEWIKNEYEEMRTANLGKDIRTMVRDFMTGMATGVKMRSGGAVYFIPRQYGDRLMAVKELVSRINDEWKTSGHECRIETVEVIDSAEKRQMVQRRVEQSIEQKVSSALDAAFDELNESQAAYEVVDELTDSDEFEDAGELASEHSDLLDIELSVKSVLEDWKDRVTTEAKEDLIDEALDRVE